MLFSPLLANENYSSRFIGRNKENSDGNFFEKIAGRNIIKKETMFMDKWMLMKQLIKLY